MDEGVIEQGYKYCQQDPRQDKTDKPPAENFFGVPVLMSSAWFRWLDGSRQHDK